MSTPRAAHGVAVLEGLVYAAGGEGIVRTEEGEEVEVTLASAEVYDPATNSWSPLPPMREARSHFGLVAKDQWLYAFGGECEGRLKSSIERYDPRSREWALLQDMPEPRSQMGVVNNFDSLYVVGGVVQTARGGRALSSDLITYFHPTTTIRPRRPGLTDRSGSVSRRGRDRKSGPARVVQSAAEDDVGVMLRLAPMRRARSALAGVVDKRRSYLYVLGGVDDEDHLKLVERYCFDTGRWEDLEDLLQPRCALVAGATLDALVAVGGGLHWTHDLSADVELYDHFERRWVPQRPMPQPRAGAGAVSISRI